MNKSSLWVAPLFWVAAAFGEQSVQNMMELPLLLEGRWDRSSECLCTSAPASSISFNAKASSISFDLSGEARYRFDIDGKTVSQFKTRTRAKQKMAALADGKFHHYRLIKISESNPGKACLHSLALDAKGAFGEAPKPSHRRIEFIGDSFTVGYGNEAVGADDGTPFEKTNASLAYSFLLAEGFKADYQINAVSGRGLVRNYANIEPEWTLRKLYNFTVAGAAPEGESSVWDFQDFHPHVIVIFVGINDFQGEPPYADEAEFREAYARLLTLLRNVHPGVKFLLVSTKVWPNDNLTPTVQRIYDDQVAAGMTDLEFTEVFTENSGLHGHPSKMSHVELANTLRPIIGRLGGWISR